jgi:hypothetical protein
MKNRHGKKKTMRIHRLVAMKFLPRVEGKDVVDHINGKRDDNRVENLRWATVTENNHNIHVKWTNLGGTCKVDQLDDNGAVIKTFDSVTQTATEMKVDQALISRACLSQKKYKGYWWRYHDSEQLLDEEWRTGLYNGFEVEVSNKGRIKGRGGRPYRGRLAGGYRTVERDSRNHAVHRIICAIFNPHPDHENLDVDHVDGNKQNNESSNLQWVTKSENMIRFHALKRKRKLSTTEPEQVKKRKLVLPLS